MPPTLSLIAPCLNEQDNVAPLATRFLELAKKLDLECELIFVDDGSTDNTVQYINDLQEIWGSAVHLVSHSSNLGIPTAWRSGVTAAKGRLVCLIDADLQNRPESVFDLYEAYEAVGSGLVQGVRVPTNRNLSRLLMSRALNFVLNATFRMRSADNKSGFVLCEKSNMMRILHHHGRYRHFQTFIGVSAAHCGLNIIEVRTPFDDRRAGESFLAGRSWKVSLEVLRDLKTARLEFARQ